MKKVFAVVKTLNMDIMNTFSTFQEAEYALKNSYSGCPYGYAIIEMHVYQDKDEIE